MLRTVLAILLALSLSAQASGQPKESKFLWISDLHFNPMADPALVKDLEAAEPAQWQAILDRTLPNTFGRYKSDSNWWLLKSAMGQFSKTLRHPSFVMVTGDLLAHGFPDTFRAATHDTDQQHYAAFVRKTVQFLALQLQRQFPGVKIFITPGNNDDDCGDYAIEANGTFLSDTSEVARQLAGGDDQFVSDWKSLGSYIVPHPTMPDVRIISLNSIFWSQKYQALSSEHACAPASTTAPADLLVWLERNLAAAAQANRKVSLMFHIPPGIDGYTTAMKNENSINSGAAEKTETCSKSITPMWAPDWASQFDDLLAKHSSTVLAGFAAHIHSDDFRLIGPAGAGRQFVLLNPAISPIYGQNPGFRVVSYRHDGTVTDQTTYYLTNLTSASSTTRGKWKQEYTFTRQWKAQTLDAASLSSVYSRVVADPKARAQWLKDFAVLGPSEQDEKKVVRALYCADEGLSVDDYRACYCGTGVSH